MNVYFKAYYSYLLALILTLNIFSVTGISPSDDEEEGRKGSFYLTPDFGLQFGIITRIEFAPALGYHLTDRFSAALGGRYEYYKNDLSFASSYNTHIWGIRSFIRYNLIKDTDNLIPLGLHFSIFGHAEYEMLNLERKYFDFPSYPDEGRFWMGTTLLGVGLRQPSGRNTSINFLVLWDIENNIASPYANPVIRVGVQIYL